MRPDCDGVNLGLAHIQKGEKHQLANLGGSLLQIIEVQVGEFLGEGDIHLFKDSYGRIRK